MQLIKRQDYIMAAIERIHVRKYQNPGQKSKAARKLMEFNEKRMTFAGYTAQEAKESFRQCLDMVTLQGMATA